MTEIVKSLGPPAAQDGPLGPWNPDEPPANNRLLVADDRELLERIQALADAMAEGQTLPRSEMEPIVTDGYARALELDAECLRIEQRLDEMAEHTVVGHVLPRGELSGLLGRLHEASEQSKELRALLAPLRKVVSRAAA
jgi:hypothetical protein